MTYANKLSFIFSFAVENFSFQMLRASQNLTGKEKVSWKKVSTRIRCLLITVHFKISLEICMMQRKFSVAYICSLVRVSFSWSIHCTVLQPKSTNCEKNLRDTSLIRIIFQNISGLSNPSIELILKVFFI